MEVSHPTAKPLGQAGITSLRRWLQIGIPRAFAWLATTIYGLTGDWRTWLPLGARTSAHLAVIVVALLAIGLSNVEWPAQAAAGLSAPVLSASAGGDEKGEHTLDRAQVVLDRSSNHQLSLNSASTYNYSQAITRLAQPHTIIPERPRLDVVTYTVQAGDTVQSIAAQFGLQPTTIMWADSAIEDAPDLLQIGQQVTILPIDGVYHQVTEEDTVESIAEKYKVEPEAIITCSYNHLSPPDYAIRPGMRLIAPGGEKPYVPKVVTVYAGSVPAGAQGTGQFQWPVLGSITQGYWYGHRAIDIGASTGSAVLAADGGFVSFAGWTDLGYGYLIVIDHANGFATYYAHLSGFYVQTGQAVGRGQVIGAVGSTGWSTGPHLHFEVRYYDTQQNPRVYLP
ncbi:MAG TPA: LysM peptidoglycan-binding domain-containing protein [Chloroflexi bacterium]|nr:LysM peptidoglycan-binding domain-containing protein [Chloroflexota bacterium]